MAKDPNLLCFTAGKPYCRDYLDHWEGGTYGMKDSHVWCKRFRDRRILCVPETGPIEKILVPDECPHRQQQGDLFAGKGEKVSEDSESTESLINKLLDAHKRWEKIYHDGCSDPFHEDGGNLWLVRNHIANYKKKLEGRDLPAVAREIYNRPLPPEVPMDYMARPDEIREAAKRSLETYEADENYKYMVANADRVDPKAAKAMCIANILNYVVGLKICIAEDDLVSMRRHRNPATYLESFAQGAIAMRDYFEAGRQGQMTIWDQWNS